MQYAASIYSKVRIYLDTDTSADIFQLKLSMDILCRLTFHFSASTFKLVKGLRSFSSLPCVTFHLLAKSVS